VPETAPLLVRVAASMAGLERDEPGVVAISGGADSVALLRALLAGQWGKPLVMAHLNHQLRGAESDGDEEFVRSLHGQLSACGGSNLLLQSERIDVRAEARALGENLENVARRIRYDWLANVARDAGARWVATGHTANDQAETVLHRLLRGTGLKGLAGIPQRRELAPGLAVVRPLLHTQRDEVLAFLGALGQAYRRDSSNADLSFTRNRIRHQLLPSLAADFNPAIVLVLCRLAEQAAEVQQGQEVQAAQLLREAELPRAGSMVVLDAQCLACAPRPRRREMLRLVWAREGWPQGRLGFVDWDRMASMAEHGEAAAIDLPGGIRLRRRGHVLQIQGIE
jgi:tRNA(Ile)-lysidine synthase